VTTQASSANAPEFFNSLLEIMYGYEKSRESAQIQGDTALFELLSEGQP